MTAENVSFQDLGHVTTHGTDKDIPLRILQLTDLHLFPGSGEWLTCGQNVKFGNDTRYSTQKCLALMLDIVARVHPQLVVLTGDIIDGRPFHDSTAWSTALKELVEPIVNLGCQWTFVPGNHDDDESPWSREDLLAMYDWPGCISKGASTWDHTVTFATGPDGPSARLFFFDSGGNDAVYKYGTVKSDAVKGFHDFNLGLSPEQRALPGLSFYHIPVPEVTGLNPICGRNGLFDAALMAGMVPKPWCFVPKLVRLLGKDRIVGSSKLNSGLFQSMVETSSVQACFFGHDHHSDAVFCRDGIYHAYGRVGSCLPPSDWEGKAPLPFAPGARVIEVKVDVAEYRIETWIETRDGEEEGSRLVLATAGTG